MTTARPLLARHVPPAVPPGVLVGITVVFALLSILRGLDYATAPAPAGGSLILLDAFGSIHLWGWLLIGAGAHLIGAYVIRVHAAVWWGHIVLAALYAAMLAAIVRSGSLDQSYATVVVPIGSMIWHVLIAYLTRPLPPRTATTTRPGA